MSDSARVTSVESLVQLLNALRNFREEAASVLIEVDQYVLKNMAWFEHEAPFYWKQQARRCYDEINMARSRLERCKSQTVAGHEPSCYEEEQDYRAARRKLEVAQEKQDVVRRWTTVLHREIDEYRGRAGKLRQSVDYDLVQSLALLERTVDALEAYLGRSVRHVEEGRSNPPEEIPGAENDTSNDSEPRRH